MNDEAGRQARSDNHPSAATLAPVPAVEAARLIADDPGQASA
jgi:hypothetical protein